MILHHRDVPGAAIERKSSEVRSHEIRSHEVRSHEVAPSLNSDRSATTAVSGRLENMDDHSTRYRTYLLFGMPGSGKGTQGAVLGRLPDLVHISMGDIFRRI